MAVKAVYNGVRMSPRKVDVVAALVRGRSVADAVTILNHTPRRAAAAVKKPSLVPVPMPNTTITTNRTVYLSQR